ncbi:MCE family protein [Mycobacterium sp. OTB74]|jgi:phospholipid/cholesterol/gamma-HCH transport system substrate-binding protein|uniref:MCE family protein n=1 Tax=Mycobacterium sp. OTB74 TaxID=1853452 RepID=UPI00247450DB|nr:MCE family protein [Mycobacterium sp. OTB74]MDH6246405.1 phospholipid/cholesterol/gamma-HCH transport system substrate-binding protein [Mycobacterium sp. OTB74]
MNKTFSERNPVPIGAIGLLGTLAIVLAALNFQKLPFLNQTNAYSAYFAEAGGLHSGAAVDISGFPAGKVSSVELDGPRVLVKFNLTKNVHLGERTEAAIKTKSLLGSKILEVNSRGEGDLRGPIPLERTVSPYQLPDALGDLTTTISGMNTDQLSDSLATLSQTFANTAPQLRDAVSGVGRISQTLNERDAHLRTLLQDAAKATGVLAKRSDQVVSLLKDTNSLLAELRTQSAALDQIWGNISAVSHQLKAFIAENRTQLRPALDKLNGVLAIVDNRRERVQQSIKGLSTYALSLGESVGSGPFFKAYVSNLLPGQFVQPFVDAAFSDLGLDQSTLLPSQLTDPPTGQRGTPPLPVPYPRTGQGGEPRQTLPDAITGNQDPGLPAQFPGRYPYRQEPPAPPPGGPPPGPPAPAPPGLGSVPQPTPSPVYVTAPGEVPPSAPDGGQR